MGKRIMAGIVMEQKSNSAPVPHPRRPSSAALATVERACRYIESRREIGEGVVTLTDIGAYCRMSPWHLQRLFKQIMGVTPRQYADAHRVKRLKDGLQQGDSVAGATFEAGYGSSSRIYERAAAELGMTPSTYRKGGLGAEIGYAIAASPLGRLLAAATPKGVCFIGIGETDRDLESALRQEFPKASAIRRDEGRLGSAIATILAYLEGTAPHIDLPLDVRATAFQRRVWEELRRIPYGETRSYGEIAEAVGVPESVRAVGRACATNPVALIVPCHRVVREDGSLSGYRWGLARKQALLEREGNR
ncbi:MAG TPA: methylated-DNA--[protein]-cysteine S-methyltransferase [Alphaproteobacteria bacterium]|nr:methylated-DNA--[protein]-cysteine S-methyltransferase [Alphaproteobacteria bacterium]